MITLLVNETELHFEHSLVSLSEWEAEHEKLFYGPDSDEEKTQREMDRYFQLMLIEPKDQLHLVLLLSGEQKIALAKYIGSSRTATTIKEIQGKSASKENISSELIYYWLVAFKIPFQPTETWHLNRLITLVKICGIKQAPPEKQTRQGRQQQIQSMRAANEARRAKLGTKG